MGEAGEPEQAGASTDRDALTERAHREYRIEISGDAWGPVIAGDYNLVIDARHGSTVSVLADEQRPQPLRKDRVEVLPRRRHEQLLGVHDSLAALADAIRAGSTVQLYGPRGAGKSTILRLAARTLEPGPDGVVFLTAANHEVGDLAQQIFEACYDAAGFAPSATELQRMMTGIRLTVYIDNADLSLDQLRCLTDMIPDATFVFASHDATLLGDGTVLELRGLERSAALDFLARELRRHLSESELATANELWQATAGRPMLLLRAAAIARFDPSSGGALPRPGAVADLVPLLLDQVGPDARRALQLMATLDGADVNLVHIGALTGVQDPVSQCDRLTELGLTLSGELGFRCAPDVLPALNQRASEPIPVEQIAVYFAQWAEQSTTTPEQVADEILVLERAAKLSEQAGKPELAVRIARAASPKLARSLRFDAWGLMLDPGLAAARAAGDKQAEAYFTHEKGIWSLLTGRRVLFAVLLGEALLLWRELGDSHGVATATQAQQFAPQVPPIPPSPVAPTSTQFVPNGTPAAANGTPPTHAIGTPTNMVPHAAHAEAAAQEMTRRAANAHVPQNVGTGGPSAGPGGTTTGTAAAKSTTAATAATAATGKIASILAVLFFFAIVADPGLIGKIIHALHHAPTGLAGQWEADGGQQIITISGSGELYHVSFSDTSYGHTCPESFLVFGIAGGNIYNGNAPAFDVSSSFCSRIGYLFDRFTLSADGSTILVTTRKPVSEGTLVCYTCGTVTLTRKS
jgi:energy-coupling factor transporter ATP-binding protein EcfA2